MHNDDLSDTERKDLEDLRKNEIAKQQVEGLDDVNIFGDGLSRGNFVPYWNPATGQMIRKPRTYDPYNSDNESEGLENIEGDIEQAQADITREIGNIPNLTTFELLEERFNRNIYA